MMVLEVGLEPTRNAL